MTERLVIDLPYPPADLSPNSRLHPMALHRAKKKAKQDAFWLAKYAMPHRGWTPPFDARGRLPVRITFHPIAGKAAKDVDNYVASEKARIDGIAEAMSVDDKLFDLAVALGTAKPNGGVTYEIGVCS